MNSFQMANLTQQSPIDQIDAGYLTSQSIFQPPDIKLPEFKSSQIMYAPRQNYQVNNNPNDQNKQRFSAQQFHSQNYDKIYDFKKNIQFEEVKSQYLNDKLLFKPNNN